MFESLEVNIVGIHHEIFEISNSRREGIRAAFGQRPSINQIQPPGFCFGITLNWLEHTLEGKNTCCEEYFKQGKYFSAGVACNLQRINMIVGRSTLVSILNSRRGWGVDDKYKEISKVDLYNKVNNISFGNFFKKKPKAFVIYLKDKSGSPGGHVVALVRSLDKFLIFDSNIGVFKVKKKHSLDEILKNTILKFYSNSKQDYEVSERHIMVE